MNRNTDGVNDELHLSTMRILKGNPDTTQRELAKRLGISLGGINYCLEALADIGYIKASRFKRSEKVGVCVHSNACRYKSEEHTHCTVFATKDARA